MKNKILLGIALLIILAILILFYNCTQKSTKYEFKKDYYLYASDIGGSERRQIYVFSTQTDSLVDSIYLGPDIVATALALSPDKKTLYARCERILSDTSREYLGCEIDTRNKRLKYIGPNSFTEISPDGKYLFGSVSNEFTIFDAQTHQVVYQDSINYFPFCFDEKAHLAYGIRLGARETGKIRVFDYESMRWVRTITIRLRDGILPAIGYQVLSPDGNTLYLVTGYYFNIYFCVYDLLKDSLLVQLGINSAGEIAIKPDGSKVYITDPGGGNGCIVFWPPPTGVLGVFDTKTNTPLPGIDLTPLGDSFITLNPSLIKITPDGEKAYLSICQDRILVIDLIRNEPLKAIVIPKGNLAVHSIAL